MKAYVPPILTIDAVIFQLINNQLNVLLIKRLSDPFKGQWALPGGYNPAGETTQQALSRMVKTKAGLDTKKFGVVEQLYTFDSTGRDPRGHAVSVSYMCLGHNLTPQPGPKTEEPQFFPVSELPKLAYDHAAIIKYAHERLASKITYTNVAFSLLPKLFSLAQLQSTYESVFGRELDKRNFRKRVAEMGIVKTTDRYSRDGAHRPARLHCFSSQKLQILSRKFS